MPDRLEVLVDARVRVDRITVEELVAGAAGALGVSAEVVWCDAAAWRDRLSAPSPMSVVVPGGDVEVAALAGDGAQRGAIERDGKTDPGLVRFDLHDRERDHSPQVARHLRGIGLGGLTWAVRAAVHAARHPATSIAYGDHPQQFGHLRLPPGRDGSVPVAVLLHGGYWRSRWQLDLMDAVAVDLCEHGYATWNLEYRRPDRHGWDATVADVRDGVRYVADLAGRFEVAPSPAAVIGHSAGGQLALQVTEELADERAAGSPGVVVSLAGVVDLAEAYAREMGAGAVAMALGGSPIERPDRYLAASPIARDRRQVPTIVVQGADDDPDLAEMNRRFVAHIRAGGGRIVPIELPGDHFAVIDPASELWAATVEALGRLLP